MYNIYLKITYTHTYMWFNLKFKTRLTHQAVRSCTNMHAYAYVVRVCMCVCVYEYINKCLLLHLFVSLYANDIDIKCFS